MVIINNGKKLIESAPNLRTVQDAVDLFLVETDAVDWVERWHWSDATGTAKWYVIVDIDSEGN